MLENWCLSFTDGDKPPISSSGAKCLTQGHAQGGIEPATLRPPDSTLTSWANAPRFTPYGSKNPFPIRVQRGCTLKFAGFSRLSVVRCLQSKMSPPSSLLSPAHSPHIFMFQIQFLELYLGFRIAVACDEHQSQS